MAVPEMLPLEMTREEVQDEARAEVEDQAQGEVEKKAQDEPQGEVQEEVPQVKSQGGRCLQEVEEMAGMVSEHCENQVGHLNVLWVAHQIVAVFQEMLCRTPYKSIRLCPSQFLPLSGS